MQAMPPGPEPAALTQAKLAFFEALVDRNQRGAREAHAVFARYKRPEPRLTGAELAKREQRTRALVKWVEALRERRDEEKRGIFRPAPTPEEQREATAVAERFGRWLRGDDSAGPFE